MKHIKSLFIILIQLALIQSLSAQDVLDNGRPAGVEPGPVVQTTTPATTNNSSNPDSDQDVPGEIPEVLEDTYYPLDLDILQEEVHASMDPADLAENINDLFEQIDNLNRVVEELRLENQIMRESLGNCCDASGLGLSAKDAYLVQNAPNPFNETTTIKYFVPSGLENAEIRISDVKGEVLQSLNIEPGFGTIEVSASTLSTGSFIYMLVVGNEIVDSKVMILTQ